MNRSAPKKAKAKAKVKAKSISERKRAEQALRESEQRLRAILNAALDAIVTIDQRGIIVTVNPAVKRLFGYSEKELVGKDVGVLMPSPHRERHGQYLESYQRTGEAKIIGIGREVIARRKDGSMFPAELSVSKVDDLGFFTGVVRDITEYKAAEEALRREHEFNEKIIHTARTIVLVLDSEGRVVRFNPYFEELSGWKLKEVEGRAWLAAFIPERERKRIGALFKRAVGGVRTRGNINPILTKEGSERLIEWYDAPLTDEDGALVGLLCTGIDVTDRHRLEQEVINAAEEERRRTAQDLHDGLGSLLTGIDFRMKALANACVAQELAQAEEVATISKLIRDAITQAKAISKGLHPVGAHPEDLMNALMALVSQVRSTTGAECRFRCRPPVFIDNPVSANHLFRIAQEALNNAIKYSEAAHITVSLAQKEGQTLLKIMDDGKGFDPDRLPGSGGLGLHVMRYRAHAINASFTIQPRRRGGTKVHCAVPAGS